jgi:molybdopterin converting factor subunit 1
MSPYKVYGGLTLRADPWQVCPMHVTVRLFAALREAVGRGELRLELPDGARLEDAWQRLAAEHPGLAARRPSLAAALNRQYAAFDAVLNEGDEVAFIPPVSGG